MAAMKTMTAIAVDARPSMAGSVSRDGVSKINVALGITSHHIVQRQMASKTVEFSVSAFGAGVTKNSRHAEDGSCVNVETVCEMGKPSVDDLRRVDGITAGGDDAGDCDFVDAIDVALDNLKRVNAGKKYNRIMLIITDGEFVVSDMEPLEHLLRDMKANDISLYVAIVGHKDKELVSNIVSENGKLLASMVGATGGAFCVVDQISDSFYFFAGRPGMTSRPLNYKIPLYISPSVKIRCQYWSKVSKATLPSLKKQSPSYDPEQPDSGTVKRTTSYFNPDDPDQEIPFDEKVKGYRYGANYVPVSAADEAALKISSEPLMRLIGFLPESKILRYHFLESTLVLQGDASSPVAESALSALSIALREKKSVALVRFVKRADSDPWLAALIPFPSDSSCLMIQRLPCAEDIRDFPFPSLYDKRYGKPNTKAQMTAVSNFVDQLTITPDDIAVFNPSFPALTAKILRNVLSESKSPNSLLAEVGNPLCGPAEIRDRADGALKRVLSEFSLTTVDKKKKKRKIYWSDYEVAASTEDVLQQSSVAIAVS